VKGTPESGNAIAGAVRDLGFVLKMKVVDAVSRHLQGCRSPRGILNGETALTEATTAKARRCHRVPRGKAEEWEGPSHGAQKRSAPSSRQTDITTSRLAGVSSRSRANHPIQDGDSRAAAFLQARKDLEAITSEKAVFSRWPDYRSAYETAFISYRDAYLEAHDKARVAAEGELAAIRAGSAYAAAPAAKRDLVVGRFFGSGKPCDYPPMKLSTVESLLRLLSGGASRR
jgi:hypothetical protein